MFDSIQQHAYSLVGEEVQKPWYEEMEEQLCSLCPSMSFQNRLICCIFCIFLGFMISVGSTMRLVQLVAGDPYPFAILYTTGNLLGICSTCFLYGPTSQIKKMFVPTRALTSVLYVVFMIATLVIAFYPKDIPGRALWIVLLVFCQFVALLWYTLSYIPFARSMAVSCFSRICDMV